MAILLGISGTAGVGKTTAANVFVNDFYHKEISFADPIKRAALEWWDFSEDQLWGESEQRNKPDKRYLIYEGAHEPIFSRPKDPDGPKCARCGVKDKRIIRYLHYDFPCRQYLTPRYALQHIGDLVRQIDSDVWLRLALTDAKKIIDRPKVWSYYRSIGVYPQEGFEPINGIVFGDCRYPNEMYRVKKSGGLLIRIKRPGAGLSGKAGKHASETAQSAIPDSFFDFVINNDKTLDDFIMMISDVATKLCGPKPENKQLSLF